MTAKSSFNEKLNIPKKISFKDLNFRAKKNWNTDCQTLKLILMRNFKKKSLETDKKRKEVRFNFIAAKDSGKVSARKLQDLKLAFSEYYLGLVLLQNYQNLNYTGFRKILKKHDKNLSRDSGAIWRSKNVDNAPFYTNKVCQKQLRSTFCRS